MTKREIFYNIVNTDKNNDKLLDIDIKNVEMNTKKIKKGDLFIAIRGGNKFINEAFDKGAIAVVYDDKNIVIDNDKYKKSFYVEDSVVFLQEFAKKWRENLNIKVIGITGSNGKTTVKDIIYHFLKTKYKGKKTEGNFNNYIGLPFTLLRSEKDDDFIILEMGMSNFGEIDLLGQISHPDISVITNIGESHLEFLKTKENVFKAKTEILPYTKEMLVINGDDCYLKNIKIENKKIKVVRIKKRTSEFKEESFDFYYGDIVFDEKSTSFSLKYFGQKCRNIIDRNYETNVLGEHNILNIVMSIATTKYFGMEDKLIEEALKNIVMTDMRFQKIEKDNIIYINDAYNASPMSMKKSLETFSEIYNDIEKIVVLGDMLELGEKEIEYHTNLFDDIKKTKCNNIYLYGHRMQKLYEKLKENKKMLEFREREILYFENKEDITKKIRKKNNKKAVLLKASRGMRLEEIIN